MSPKVLLAVADRSESAELVAEFRRHDWEVVVAEDAIGLLPVARRESPDAIVIDCLLPGGRAEQVVLRIRSLAATAVTPLVVLMAGDPWRAKALVEAGAQEVVTKPAASEQVREAVGRHLGITPAVERAPRVLIEDESRMAALRSTGLLDSEEEEAFDRYTRLASRLLDAPQSLVNLIDAERQFYKARVGPGGDLPSAREAPLSHSFCQYVVGTAGTVIVNDARSNPLTRINPAVEEYGVEAYIGAPVTTFEGDVLGSLCAFDSQPREWSDEDAETLDLLATMLTAEIEVKRASAPAETLKSAAAALVAIAQLAAGRGARLGEDDRADLAALASAREAQLAGGLSGLVTASA